MRSHNDWTSDPTDPAPPREGLPGLMSPEFAAWEGREMQRRLNHGAGPRPPAEPSRWSVLDGAALSAAGDVRIAERRRADIAVRLEAARGGLRARLGRGVGIGEGTDVAELEAEHASASQAVDAARSAAAEAAEALALFDARERLEREAREADDAARGVLISPDGRRVSFNDAAQGYSGGIGRPG